MKRLPRVPALHSLLGGRVFSWAPIYLPSIFLAHFALLGLKPTWQRSRELEAESAQIELRTERLVSERRELELDLRRLEDPIYRERVRRSLITPGMRPLLVDPPPANRR